MLFLADGVDEHTILTRNEKTNEVEAVMLAHVQVQFSQFFIGAVNDGKPTK